ncbi:MAG: hypothetical protein PHD81_02545 [Candidatus Nanoarchaeia archaeon]|nr:hypothetical protein [Candidatus Nanoarchaeia archaeon]MDD5587965.1 hypothetical protein [Candidatus Nanoarchaeia archaeon]
MVQLVACLSSGKGTWGHVNRLIEDSEWENIYLITNEFGKENFHPKKNCEFIIADSNQGLKELRDSIQNQLNGKLKSEVALNLVSGIGKEHMAILSALLRLGVGIRLTALTKDGIEEI